MDQLVALQEIYASFSKGGDGLQKIDSKTIQGSCPELISKLLDSSRKSRIDEDVCRELSLKLQDVYEVKRLGDICRRAGLSGLAINTYNRAMSLCRDPILRPVLQNNLGQAFVHQGDLAKAAFYYQKAADCFAKEGDHIGLAHVLGNLGSAYRSSGDWDKAIEHCYRSLKTFEEKGDDLGIAQMTGSLGRIYADMGEKELAARYFERSLTDFQRLGDKRSAAWVLDRLGRIAGQRMDWDKALSYFNSSLSLFDRARRKSEPGNCSIQPGTYLPANGAGNCGSRTSGESRSAHFPPNKAQLSECTILPGKDLQLPGKKLPARRTGPIIQSGSKGRRPPGYSSRPQTVIKSWHLPLRMARPRSRWPRQLPRAGPIWPGSAGRSRARRR